MIYEQCETLMETLFATFSRRLDPKTVAAWFVELKHLHEADVEQAIRELKTAEKLPTLGEIKQHAGTAARRAQYRVDMQAGLDDATPPKTRYGRISLSLLRRMFCGRLTYAQVCAYQCVLMARYNVNSLPLTGDLEVDHAAAKLWKEHRWREDLGKLRGLRKVDDYRFEPVREGKP